MGHFVFVGITIHAEHYLIAVRSAHFGIFKPLSGKCTFHRHFAVISSLNSGMGKSTLPENNYLRR